MSAVGAKAPSIAFLEALDRGIALPLLCSSAVDILALILGGDKIQKQFHRESKLVDPWDMRIGENIRRKQFGVSTKRGRSVV